MTDTNSAILSTLAHGEKSRLQLASELNIPQQKVGGILVSLIYAGQVVVSKKIKKGGREVSIYAVPSQAPVKIIRAPAKPLPDEEILSPEDSNLYKIWGGYAKVDKQLTKSLTVRKHIES